MKINNVIVFIVFLFSFDSSFSKEYIEVIKKNVLHKFVPFDELTDDFVINRFAWWENETFDVFETVKDPNGIAIDIGAWIGTTAIWLSKNFHHVIAIDADPISLICMRQNLVASDCLNVSICEYPIAHLNKKVIFGTRWSRLNESVSYIKEDLEENNITLNGDDFIIPSLTFKQLLENYVYANPNLKAHKISFIKCDIEGGEEDILEDILYYAYYNNIKVYMSFHLTWWKSKKIENFETLFKLFRTNCPSNNICEYIRDNPFTSLLLKAIE